MKPILARIRYKPLQVDLWPFTDQETLIVGGMVLAAISFLAGFFARGL